MAATTNLQLRSPALVPHRHASQPLPHGHRPAEPQPQQSQAQPPTQSWAAWLLDAYATTATSPATPDFPHDYNEDGTYRYSSEYTEAEAEPQKTATIRVQPITNRQQQRWFSDSEASSSSSSRSTNTLSPVSAASYTSSSSSFSTHSARSVSATSSMQQQPYARNGRGGAGNFVWGSMAVGSASVKTDTAAVGGQQMQQMSGSLPLAERRKAAGRLQRLQTTSNVAVNVGRGGAGNYTTTSGATTTNTNSIGIKTPTVEGQSSPRKAHAQPSMTRAVSSPAAPMTGSHGYGRGGAGNLSKAVDDSAKRKQADQERDTREAEERRRAVEEQVDGWLRAPPVAMVGAGRVGRFGDGWGD